MNKFEPIISPYFGEVGITSTNADYIANMAKHACEAVEEKLSNINFVQETATLIGTEQPIITKKINHDGNVDSILSDLNYISRCKSLIAFLREAIKKKEELLEECNQYQDEEYEKLQVPVREHSITEKEVIANFSVKEQERYLSLSTRSAVIGKFIHPLGSFDKARNAAMRAANHSSDVDYNGRDTIVKNYDTVDLGVLDGTLALLQHEHRKSEAELNGIRKKIEDTIAEDTLQKDRKFQDEYIAYRHNLEIIAQRQRDVQNARRLEIRNLKIVIPNEYKDLYDTFSKG